MEKIIRLESEIFNVVNMEWIENTQHNSKGETTKLFDNLDEELRNRRTEEKNGIDIVSCEPTGNKQQTLTGFFKHKVNSEKVKLGLQDFEIKKYIGKGNFGKVFQVQKTTGRDVKTIFAMKVLKKSEIVRKQKDVTNTRTERKVLGSVKHPFIVELKYAFQTSTKLYFILEYLSGGDLFFHMDHECFLVNSVTCFYICEITLALGYLHKLDIIYRDLKPENILFDAEGHIKLADFGLSKILIHQSVRTNSYCGTKEYMAPEILTGKGHGKAADWWSLGVLLYEMLVGNLPYKRRTDRYRMFRHILHTKPKFPEHITSEAKNLIDKLLQVKEMLRLGSGPEDAKDVQMHPFFKDVCWDDVLAKRLKPPFRPVVRSEDDVSQFDMEYTTQIPKNSHDDNTLNKSTSTIFEDFSFEAPSIFEEMQNCNNMTARSPNHHFSFESSYIQSPSPRFFYKSSALPQVQEKIFETSISSREELGTNELLFSRRR